MQADLRELQQTSHQGGYYIGTANNPIETFISFANLEKATAEDRAAVTNFTTTNSTLTNQLALYVNRLSIKGAGNMAVQKSIKNIQGEVKNIKAEVANLKNSGHYGSARAANKDNGRITPMWKLEGQSHHPTWRSTTYCCIHGAGGHAEEDFKNKRPGHKSESI